MTSEEKLASITPDGAILMGSLFCCDGHSYEKKHFVFSHMHSDHVEKLPKCLYTGSVYLSKPTRDLLEAINNENYGGDNFNAIKKNQIKTLDYGESKFIEQNEIKERIVLYESKHVLGSSQVEILTKDNVKIVYSGDITSKDVPPKNIHTLILDAVHGHPKYTKYSESDSIERRFVDKIEDVIHGGQAQPVVIHAHKGKLQEIMSLIANHKDYDSFPQLASKSNLQMLNVYKKYGFKINDNMNDDKSDEFERIRDSDWPYIQYSSSFRPTVQEMNQKAYSIYFYDSLPDQVSMDDSGSNSTKFATAAHADYENLIKYVENANPEHIIVDGHRSKQYRSLTEQLKSRGFNAEYQPAIRIKDES